MNMNHYMPVRIVSGRDCVRENGQYFCVGSHALIVTGKNSARACGALDDVIAVLREKQIAYDIFDKVRENPLLSVCEEGGEYARQVGADLVIGIGGGSPLDAAKAIAAFAADGTLHGKDLFDASCRTRGALPILLIPTTAGTGSEVNPYAVMTLDGEGKKRSYSAPEAYAKTAFLDGKYLLSMQPAAALSCALDAFCHCTESFFSPKSTYFSTSAALEGAGILWRVLRDAMADGIPVKTPEQGDLLLDAACLGGLAINVTGTGFPHPLGYNLTLDRGIPHGRACAAFTGEYLKTCAKSEAGRMLLPLFCRHLGTTPDVIGKKIPSLAAVTSSLTDGEIERYVSLVCTAGNFRNCVTPIGQDEMTAIYRRLFQDK